MPYNIGPEMLEILDEDLAAGRMSQAQYDAQRVEVVELIRKGRAVRLTTYEVVLQWVLYLGGIALGLTLMVGLQTPAAFLLGVVVAVATAVAARRVGRVRP